MTGSWKNASGVLQSAEIFCNQESGNPVQQSADEVAVKWLEGTAMKVLAR